MSDQQRDFLKVYQFILVTTWAALAVFSAVFFMMEAWFPFAVVATGALIINPICWWLAKKNNSIHGRKLFVAACSTYVLLGSVGCNNQIDAQYFFIAISISCVVLFKKDERKWTVISLAWIFLFWTLTQFEASQLIPIHYIATDLPVVLLQNISFLGSLVLSLFYLLSHVQAIEKNASRVQNATLMLNQEKVEALNLLTQIADNVPGVVYQFRLAPDGKVSVPYASQGMARIFRASPDEIKNEASVLFKKIHPDDLDMVMASIQDSANSLSSWQCDYRVKYEDGTLQWHQGIAKPTRESDGSTLWHGFITDITDQKKLEQDLEHSKMSAIHASRLASLGEMAGGVAHEINSPLTVITLKVSMIRQYLADANPQIEKAKAELDMVNSTTFRIAKIVKGLLTFSRGGESKSFEEVSVENLLSELSSLCSEKSKAQGVELQISSKPKLSVLGNPIQISQVILNLINNSFDAISNLESRWIKVSVKDLPSQDLVEFSVTDSGSGLKPHQLEKLMQPFYTTKEVGKGTGLGLSISKGIVESHGGSLKYDPSSENTRFYFQLKRSA